MRAVHDQKTYLGCTGQDPQGHLSVRVDLRTNVSPTVAPRKVMNHTLAIVLTTVLKVLSGWMLEYKQDYCGIFTYLHKHASH